LTILAKHNWYSLALRNSRSFNSIWISTDFSMFAVPSRDGGHRPVGKHRRRLSPPSSAKPIRFDLMNTINDGIKTPAETEGAGREPFQIRAHGPRRALEPGPKPATRPRSPTAPEAGPAI
jgi:hypothetical protein